MTNRIIKKSHFAKSKILLTIICILGLVFSYSCNCRNNSTAPGDVGNEGQGSSKTNDKIDPKFFTITTNSVTNLLVQKASDTTGKSFAYQPSIKFSEANNNAFAVDYEVTDNATTDKIEKANVTYDKDSGSITFDKTAVLDKLKEDKKTITIKFTVKANDPTLQNPETNFTLSVDLKKTKGNLPTSAAKNLIQRLAVFQFVGGGYVNFSDPDATVTDGYFMGKVVAPTGKNTFEYSKSTCKQSIIDETKKKNDDATADKKIPYGKAEYTQDKDGGSGKWMFELKFTFNDTDYDLTDDQKNNGMKYQIYIDRIETENQDGTKSYVLNWID